MNTNQSIAVLTAFILLTGCAKVDRYQTEVSDWWAKENIFLEQGIGQRRSAESARYRIPPTHELMSNENVTVYSLDAPADNIGANRGPAQRPQQQSFIKSSVAFDPSVEVYALDNNQDRPSYVPQYAVPSYGAMDSAAISPIKQVTPVMDTAPVQMPEPALPQNDSDYTSTDLMQDIQKKPLDKKPGRRSRPVLTAYE